MPFSVRRWDTLESFSMNTARSLSPGGLSPRLSKAYLAKHQKPVSWQLYEKLNRLARLGFVIVDTLPRPRRYIANGHTIIEGVEKWVEEQRASIDGLSTELGSLRKFLQRVNTKPMASALEGKLSMDSSAS